MFRRVIAGLILGPALLIGSFAWSGYLALQTIFDEDRSATVAQELLDNEQVRKQVAANIGTVIEAALPEQSLLSAEEVDAAALAVLSDPRITNLFVDVLTQTHRAFLGLDDVPQTLDLNPVATVAREQVATVSPEAADAIPTDTDWSIELPTERIPNSSPVKTFLETSVPYLAAISIVLVLISFVATNDRPSVLRRAAFWAIGTTALYLIMGYGIPALLRVVFPDQAEIFAALLTAVLRSTLLPSTVLAAVGVGLLVVSWVWPDGRHHPQPKSAPQPAPQTQPEYRSVAPSAPPPTTHIAPARPQGAAPPQQPVTPPSTPVVPATPPSNPVIPAEIAAADDVARRDPFAPPPSPSADEFPPPIITGSNDEAGVIASTVSPPSEPPPFRPTLPTRASPSEPITLPAWTGDLSPPPDATPTAGVPKARPPRWIDGHGWVLDPDDDRPVPPNARYVEGVGYVVPGPPPRS